MILVNKDNIQLEIKEVELEKYLSMGYVKYEPKKVEVKAETENKRKPLKEEEYRQEAF